MSAAPHAPTRRGWTPAGVRVTRVSSLSVQWQPRVVVVCALLTVVLAGLGVLAMGTGTIRLTPAEVVAGLMGTTDDETTRRVVLGIRLPRLATAIGIGACLGIAGAVFQSLSRNALGSPDIVGFTTGAATGAVIQIVLFNAGATATVLAAIGGGLGTAVTVYLLSVKAGVTGGYRLVLIGIGVGAVLSAVNTLILARGQLELAFSAQLWLSGSLNARTWSHVTPVAIGLVVLTPVLIALAGHLNLMEMGDDAARQLGVRVEPVRLTLMVAAVALTALATAAAGPISFIALAAPQLVLRLTGSSRVPLISAAFMGAALVVAADLLSLHLPVNASIPIGLMTGLLGGGYLLWLLTRTRQT